MSWPSRLHWIATLCGARKKNDAMTSGAHVPDEQVSIDPTVVPPTSVGGVSGPGASCRMGKFPCEIVACMTTLLPSPPVSAAEETFVAPLLPQ